MKKRNPILGVICLVVLICAGGYFLLTGNEKAEITINGTTYEMCAVSVREFMGEDYIFAVMSTEGNSVYMYNLYQFGTGGQNVLQYGCSVPSERRVWCADFLLALQSDCGVGGDTGMR